MLLFERLSHLSEFYANRASLPHRPGKNFSQTLSDDQVIIICSSVLVICICVLVVLLKQSMENLNISE